MLLVSVFIVEGGLLRPGFWYSRKENYDGATLGIIKLGISEGKANNEQMIYNTTGSDRDEAGVIFATDNNENQIFLHTLNSIGNSSKTVFILSNESLPLYELVSDPIKKQGLKDYLDSYMKK